MNLTDNEKATKRRQRKQSRLEILRNRYWQATTVDLPELAIERGWQIQEGHCFQRIILDNVCKAVWYDKIVEPAILHMSEAQLRKATYLAEDLVSGARPIELLDERSKKWRENRSPKFKF